MTGAVPIGKILNLRTTLHRNVQRFRGGIVFKAHRLHVSLNSRLESIKVEEVTRGRGCGVRDGYPPLSSEYGTHQTVTARFQPWLSGKSG